MSTTSNIDTRAAQWLAREDRGCTEEERRALELWLQESSSHRVAYLRLKAAWDRAGRLAALHVPQSSGPMAAELNATVSMGRQARPKVLLAAAVLSAAIGLAAIIPALQGMGADEHETRLGGREVVPLADGSKVELNTDTQVRTHLTHEERTAWLDRGEAYFDVVHDASRPFVVIAGDRRVTVVGTKFSVRRDILDVQVKVLEGKVRVERIVPGQASAKAESFVAAGQVAIARKESTLVAQRTTEEVANELQWRNGLLVMNHWTLADAAREFNRYNRKKLHVEESVADIRLGGTFESSNVEAFSRLLKEGFGLKITVADEFIVVSN